MNNISLMSKILNYVSLEVLLAMPFPTLANIQHRRDHKNEGSLNLIVNKLAVAHLEKIEFVLDFKRYDKIIVTIDDDAQLK